MVKTLVFVLLCLGAVLTMGPFLIMLSYSLRPQDTVMDLPVKWLPDPVTLESFHIVLSRSMMPRWFLNSTVVTLVTTGLHIFTNSLAGYTFARKSFPGRDLIFWASMALMMVPFQVTVIPLFVIFARLGLHNNFGGLILISVSSIYGTFFFRQYITGIPRDYDDAARVDGCSDFGIYWRVILPQCGPVVAVLGAFTFISMWNSYLWPLLITTSQRMMTLPVGLALLQGLTYGEQKNQLGQMLAAATMMAIPTIVVLLVMQRHIVKGLTLSGVKG